MVCGVAGAGVGLAGSFSQPAGCRGSIPRPRGRGSEELRTGSAGPHSGGRTHATGADRGAVARRRPPRRVARGAAGLGDRRRRQLVVPARSPRAVPRPAARRPATGRPDRRSTRRRRRVGGIAGRRADQRPVVRTGRRAAARGATECPGGQVPVHGTRRRRRGAFPGRQCDAGRSRRRRPRRPGQGRRSLRRGAGRTVPGVAHRSDDLDHRALHRRVGHVHEPVRAGARPRRSGRHRRRRRRRRGDLRTPHRRDRAGRRHQPRDRRRRRPVRRLVCRLAAAVVRTRCGATRVGAAGTAGRQRAGRTRQPGQDRVPGQHESRDPHADDRRARLRGSAGRGPRRRQATGLSVAARAHDPEQRRGVVGDPRRPARPVEDRSRQAAPRAARRRLALRGARGLRPAAAPRRGARRGAALPARRTSSGPAGDRRHAVAAGPDEPGRQRRQVHRTRRRRGARRTAVRRRRSTAALVPRRRFRHRHDARAVRAAVRAVRAGRDLGDAALRRHRARPVDLPPAGDDARRHHRGVQPGRRRFAVRVLGAGDRADHGRRRGVGHRSAAVRRTVRGRQPPRRGPRAGRRRRCRQPAVARRGAAQGRRRGGHRRRRPRGAAAAGRSRCVRSGADGRAAARARRPVPPPARSSAARPPGATVTRPNRSIGAACSSRASRWCSAAAVLPRRPDLPHRLSAVAARVRRPRSRS